MKIMRETEQLSKVLSTATPIAEPEKAQANNLIPEPGRADPQMTSDEIRALSDPGDALPATTSIAKSEEAAASTVPKQPDRAEPRITSEEIRVLLDRGDALLSVADITSARLFYERAAALGNAQAAVRLGASYDPAFLAQTGLKAIRGDLTAAQYWYQRARDLGASVARVASIGQAIDPTGATEKAVTESSAEIVPERTITGNPTPQSAESGALIDKTARPTRPMAPGSRSATRRSRWVPEREVRVQPHTNGPTCPHNGHCLKPP
jgi:TPR repeat protein